MAIDTAEKRRSISGIAFRKRAPGVTPDVTKPVTWRYSVGRTYSGEVSPPPGTGDEHWTKFIVEFGRCYSR